MPCDPDSDPFRPPPIPTEVCCLHCGREYESYLIHWVECVVDGKRQGFWRCPTPGCDGAGFGFDIFPTDPEYRDADGNLMWSDDAADDEDADAEAAVGDPDGDDDLDALVDLDDDLEDPRDVLADPRDDDLDVDSDVQDEPDP